MKTHLRIMMAFIVYGFYCSFALAEKTVPNWLKRGTEEGTCHSRKEFTQNPDDKSTSVTEVRCEQTNYVTCNSSDMSHCGEGLVTISRYYPNGEYSRIAFWPDGKVSTAHVKGTKKTVNNKKTGPSETEELELIKQNNWALFPNNKPLKASIDLNVSVQDSAIEITLPSGAFLKFSKEGSIEARSAGLQITGFPYLVGTLPKDEKRTVTFNEFAGLRAELGQCQFEPAFVKTSKTCKITVQNCPGAALKEAKTFPYLVNHKNEICGGKKSKLSFSDIFIAELAGTTCNLRVKPEAELKDALVKKCPEYDVVGLSEYNPAPAPQPTPEESASPSDAGTSAITSEAQ